MCKIIASVNLNSYFTNRKANSAVKKFDKANPDLLNIDMLTKLVPRMVKMVLRVDAFKRPAGVPFFAFIKDGNPLCVVVDIQTGKAQVIDSSIIASETNVGSEFQLDGTTYKLVNEKARWKRYTPTKVNSKKYTKPRKRLTPLSPEVAGADGLTDK